MIKQINFVKADLDTVSTAAMLTDCLDNLQIKRLENKASDSDLKDSSILCIECDVIHKNAFHKFNMPHWQFNFII